MLKGFRVKQIVTRTANAVFLLLTQRAYAQTRDYGLGDATPPELKRSLDDTTANIIKMILGMVGVIFLILIIYGGITWMLGARSGKEKEISRAKVIISGAVIGLIIVLTAYAVTYWIITALYVTTTSPTTPPAT